MAFYTFDFSTNKYILQVGDRIGLEYLGTDTNNNVRSCYLVQDVGTNLTQFKNDGTGWDGFDDRVMSCQYFE